ncbi:MAG: ABC transporter ATP-binding protein, partial [Akkermansiaceae bacterium]|nr:ABC transporter ATP-binding protein [Akkermansiaceae bacterium]
MSHPEDGDHSAVVLKEVSKSFGDKRVLLDVNWSVPKGGITGLLGPNGAGKTTLFRLLMGLLKADSGQLLVDGQDAFDERIELKRYIGFLPDEPIFYNYLKGREVIELSAAMHDLNYRDTWMRISPIARRLEMDTHLDSYAEEYSRGMKKKLGLL